jgi:hypothetical protein
MKYLICFIAFVLFPMASAHASDVPSVWKPIYISETQAVYEMPGKKLTLVIQRIVDSETELQSLNENVDLLRSMPWGEFGYKSDELKSFKVISAELVQLNTKVEFEEKTFYTSERYQRRGTYVLHFSVADDSQSEANNALAKIKLDVDPWPRSPASMEAKLCVECITPKQDVAILDAIENVVNKVKPECNPSKASKLFGLQSHIAFAAFNCARGLAGQVVMLVKSIAELGAFIDRMSISKQYRAHVAAGVGNAIHAMVRHPINTSKAIINAVTKSIGDRWKNCSAANRQALVCELAVQVLTSGMLLKSMASLAVKGVQRASAAIEVEKAASKAYRPWKAARDAKIRRAKARQNVLKEARANNVPVYQAAMVAAKKAGGAGGAPAYARIAAKQANAAAKAKRREAMAPVLKKLANPDAPIKPKFEMVNGERVVDSPKSFSMFRWAKKDPEAQTKIWEKIESGDVRGARRMALDLRRSLEDGQVLRTHRFGTGISKPELVVLEDGTRGVFKPYSNAAQTANGGAELAAYTIDQQLGLNMVPLTVKRRINGVDGTLQVFVDNTDKVMLRKKPFAFVFFDSLIKNVDRNHANYLTYKGKPVAIDHGLAFENPVAKPPEITFQAALDEVVTRPILEQGALEQAKRKLAEVTRRTNDDEFFAAQRDLKIAEHRVQTSELRRNQDFAAILPEKAVYERLLETQPDSWRRILSRNLDEKNVEKFLERREKIISSVERLRKVYGDDIFRSGPTSPLLRANRFNQQRSQQMELSNVDDVIPFIDPRERVRPSSIPETNR